MIDRLRVIEDNLVVLVIATTVLGLVVPQLGMGLSGAVTPLLAALMLCVSLTFDLDTLRAVLARPGLQVLATVLVYGPMSVAGYVIGMVGFGTSSLGLGFALVGTLPTDVSSPLLVWLGRGNVALATVFNAINTALAPVMVPLLFLAYTGVELDVPVAALTLELAVTVLAPTIVGVAVRTAVPHRVEPVEPVLSAGASLAYLALLVAVVGPNADAMRQAPGTVVSVGLLALALNVIGYLIALTTRRLTPNPADHTAMLFTVSKKEFSIAAFVVFASGLPPQVALPAAVYAIVQMITSPVVARLRAARLTRQQDLRGSRGQTALGPDR